MEQEDRYRRDSLGFVDEGLNFSSSGEVKTSSIPERAEVWGELFIDAAGGTNFKFHVEKGIGFERARECLKRFVTIIQQRIDTAAKCPFFEPEKADSGSLNENPERGRWWGPGFCQVPAEQQPIMDGCYFCGRPVHGLNGEHNHTMNEKEGFRGATRTRYICVCENC